MKNLRNILIHYLLISLSLLLFFINNVYADEISIKIEGNDFTDESAILSIIKDLPKDLTNEYSNYLLKTLDRSELFENVTVKIEDNSYLIIIKEYPNLNNIIFKNNERLKDEELLAFVDDYNLTNLNPNKINNFINEVKKVYYSFGYNNINIDYESSINKKTNTADISFIINEGSITKISKIFFIGNENIESKNLKNEIKSATKSLKNIFANNNYKQFVVKNDIINIISYYKNNGYKEVNVNYKIENLLENKVNIYFQIKEGDKFLFNKIEFLDDAKLLNQNAYDKIDMYIKKSLELDNTYSAIIIEDIKASISDIIISSGIELFEIRALEKINGSKVDILFQINKIEPQYAKTINIYGNYRTFDYVIRRELSLIEGDAIYPSQIKKIENRLKSLNLFSSVQIKEIQLDDNLVDIEINVEEKQTGSVNAGLALGTVDGFSVMAGLKERNFGGTGRSVNALLNTSDGRNQYTLETTDRILYRDNVDLSYALNYVEEDFSSASSYKVNTVSVGTGVTYDINSKFRHNINLDYLIKDYMITNNSTVSSTIVNSEGENVSFLLKNNIYYSSLNSRYQPNNGTSFVFNNIIETPTSSSNGYLKNIITFKNYKKINKNVFSNQTRIGSITSLGNNDILTDDKFSLGGRWLRGFDTYGAGPRNSRTSYVGGENLFVMKFDYSRELLGGPDFPVYFNLFNDYGIVWSNKTKPTQDDESLRSSIGLGIKYYSPIGPIGLSWGFPVMEESYDIKRMFMFSIGNID